ncbi:MAG TPA: PrgI family protein [Candidatus Paceibacterota bacterium]
MRFQVPQFIETETKIIGPFTLKQFLYLAAGAVILFILQYVISLTYLIIVAVPIVIISVALAFYRIDGIPLAKYLMMALSYATGPKRYQFRKNDTENTSTIN